MKKERKVIFCDIGDTVITNKTNPIDYLMDKLNIKHSDRHLLKQVMFGKAGSDRVLFEEAIKEAFPYVGNCHRVINTIWKSQEVDSTLITQLYKYLSDYGEGLLKDRFSNETLIYIQGSGKRWYTSGEVIWDDASQVLGELYGWLSTVYKETGLRKFFLEEIGVSERVQNQDLAEAWLRLPERNDLKTEDIKASLGKIFPRLLEEVKSSHDQASWWKGFIDKAKVWTQNDEFASKVNVFVPDDYYLRNLFSKDLSFVWKPENLTHNSLGDLYGELSIVPLSEAVRASLVNPGEAQNIELPVFLTKHSKRLLCYLIYNESPEKFAELMSSGVLENLLQSVESETDSLIVRYDVINFKVHKIVTDYHAFWDPSRRLLYLRCGIDREDLLDDTVEVIARAVWGPVYKKYEDHVRTTLAITTEDRFKKLRDKKGWHLPPDIGKEIKGLITDFGQQRLDGEKGTLKEAELNPDAPINNEKNLADGNEGISGAVSTTGSPSNSDGGEQKEFRPLQGEPGNQTKSEKHSSPSSEINAKSTGITSGGYETRGKSRSKKVTDKINRQNQSRIVTYVKSSHEEPETSGPDSQEKQVEREAIGNAAEEYVRSWEEQIGRQATRMPANNPGYDIESIDSETGELRFIEVKGIDGIWGERGVGISYTQYNAARNKGKSYWLYVVEHARTENPRIHRINNPAGAITEYRFDSNWATLGNRGDNHIPLLQTEDEMVQELIELTNDNACKAIIKFCYENNLPVPEVGYEMVDENGEVAEEIELAWAKNKIAVLIGEETDIDVSKYSGWEFDSANEVVGNLENFKELLG